MLNKKVWVIGDVHGCLITLLELIELIKSHDNDSNPIIYFVGDLIDKGERSADVLDYVMENYPNNCVLGNHEKFLMKYTQLDYYSLILHRWFSGWGGKQCLESYINNKDITHYRDVLNSAIFKKHIDWIKTLKPFIQIDFDKDIKSLLVSHSFMLNVYDKDKAGDISLYNEIDLNRIIHERETYDNNNDFNIKNVFNIHGHSQKVNVDTDLKSFANVDTGCVYNGSRSYENLTAMSYPNMDILSVKNIDNSSFLF